MVAFDYCIKKLTEFIEGEFARIDSENLMNDGSFTFTVPHAMRGTTAVWGRSKKTIAPRGLTLAYNNLMKKLVDGKLTIDGYKFESFSSGNKLIFKVIRCKTLDQPK